MRNNIPRPHVDMMGAKAMVIPTTSYGAEGGVHPYPSAIKESVKYLEDNEVKFMYVSKRQ